MHTLLVEAIEDSYKTPTVYEETYLLNTSNNSTFADYVRNKYLTIKETGFSCRAVFISYRVTLIVHMAASFNSEKFR